MDDVRGVFLGPPHGTTPARLVMLYKVVRGMVPAFNADEFLIPLRNKRNIKPRLCSDIQITNFVQRYSVNHTECFKIPESKSDQFKNSFFVRTVSDWNQLEECQIRADRDSEQLPASCP